MARQLEGKDVAVPIVNVIDGNTKGAKLVSLADTTASFGHVRPQLCALRVALVGGTSVELVCFVKMSTQNAGDLGWARLADTGNLGLLGGGALPSDETYVFLAQFATIFDEFVLLAQNNVGGVDVSDGAKLIEYAEYVLKG